MNTKRAIITISVHIICYAYALLFVYAAVSKGLDYDNFVSQLGQSPLLSAFATWVAWLVPLLEIVLAIALLTPKTRFCALFGSYNLMIMFSAYIYIILNYSPFIPCSCGGILEKMGWTEHLAFNIAFVLLGFFAILIDTSYLNSNPRT